MENRPSALPPKRRRARTLLWLLCAAVFLVYMLFRPEIRQFDLPDLTDVTRVVNASLPTAAPTPDPIAAYRQSRESARTQTDAMLTALVESQWTDADVRALAQQEALDVARAREQETLLEGALAGMGLGDALCAVADGTVTVFTASPLSEAQAAALCDLAVAWTGVSRDDVRVVGVP